jgi:phage gpG-like protein
MLPSDFFNRLQRSLPDLKRKCLVVVEVETENFNMQNFENEGFTDASFQKWQPRKDKKNNRKTLVHTGDLKKAATTARNTAGGIAFVFNMPYARVHNNGLGKMPQRKFIGESVVLDKKIRRKFATVINRHLNSL